jgi:hypothetical protein
MPGEAPGLSAFDRHGECVEVAVVLRRERHGLAVGRELGEALDPLV